YLSGITPLAIKNGEIVLGVPNTLIRDRVESRFLGLIQDTVNGTTGRDLVVQLEVVAPIYEPAEHNLSAAEPDPGGPSTASAPPPPGAPTPPRNRWPSRRHGPTTPCSSTGTPAWARPTCSMQSATTSSRTSAVATSGT